MADQNISSPFIKAQQIVTIYRSTKDGKLYYMRSDGQENKIKLYEDNLFQLPVGFEPTIKNLTDYSIIRIFTKDEIPTYQLYPISVALGASNTVVGGAGGKGAQGAQGSQGSSGSGGDATSGTYIPELVNISNITASSVILESMWTKIGNIVDVEMNINIEPTVANVHTILTATYPPLFPCIPSAMSYGEGSFDNQEMPKSSVFSGEENIVRTRIIFVPLDVLPRFLNLHVRYFTP